MSHQSKVYFTRKRRRDEDYEEQLHQQKSETTSMAVTETAPNSFQTKLTDINDDCLEKVFMHLSLNDLLNIAHTNTHLKSAADMVFARKFGKKGYRLYITTLHRNERVQTNGYDIRINDLKTALRLLRCYGHLILDLSITHYTASSIRTAPIKVLHYTSQYCSNSLKKITLHGICKYMSETSMVKPLLKIETITFDCCFLGKRMSQFNTWFPAMRCLTLNKNHLTDRSSLETHFSHLEHLYIGYISDKHFIPGNVTAMFQLNPQLQRLFLYDLKSPAHLRSASRYLPVLEHLTIHGYSKDFYTDSEIHFKSVRKLEIRFFCMNNEELSSMNFLFDQLEEVDMYFAHCHRIAAAVEFLKKHQSINKLKFTASFSNSPDINKSNMMRIVTALPLLNDFIFIGAYFSVEEIIHFLAEFHLLDHFCFCISNSNDFDRLKTQLGDKWESLIKHGRVELKRKI